MGIGGDDMARPKDDKADKKRTSVDLTLDNYDKLNRYSDQVGSTYGRVLNYLIDLWLKLPLDVKKELAEHCNQEIKNLMNEIDEAGAFEKQELKKKQSKYQELAYFFSSGDTLIDSSPNLTRSYLKEGYVTYPNDWKVLSIKDPAECMYAGCVEFNRGEQYFIFFTDKKYREEYDSEDIDEIFDACIKEYPPFRDVLNAKDTSRIGLFNIYEKDDPSLPNDYEHPYGCVIIRPNSSN